METLINFTMSNGEDNKGKTLTIYKGTKFWVEYDYIAIDADGAIYNFEDKPIARCGEWDNTSGGGMVQIGEAVPWSATLEKVM